MVPELVFCGRLSNLVQAYGGRCVWVLSEWWRNGRNGTVSNNQEKRRKLQIRRLLGSYFFHISCAQSGSQAGGDMRKASSAVDLYSPSIFSTSHAWGCSLMAKMGLAIS
jgi:hypothetical protein